MRFLDKHLCQEKRLRHLEREAHHLWRALRAAPIIPLEAPYQCGWFKTYVLEARVEHRSDAAIFRAMLRAVNHRVYSRNREFLSRRGFPIVLRPRAIGLREWEKLAWPASHQRFFRIGCWRIDDEEFRRPSHRLWRRGYKLAVDWWLREDIQPVMITHQRVALPAVESRLAEIEAFMKNVNGWKRLSRLHGRRQWREPNTRTLERAGQSLAEQLRLPTPDC